MTGDLTGSEPAVPEGQAWFWTPEWQAKEREVDLTLEQGARGEIYEDGESFMQALAFGTGPWRIGPR